MRFLIFILLLIALKADGQIKCGPNDIVVRRYDDTSGSYTVICRGLDGKGYLWRVLKQEPKSYHRIQIAEFETKTAENLKTIVDRAKKGK